MESVERSKILSEVVQFYNIECVPELEKVEHDINGIFKNVLNKYKSTYKLDFLNSVYKGKYYKLSSRVKSQESISEKLVRTSDLLYLIDKYNITNPNNLDSIKDELRSFFYGYNDIVGLKIIGDLNVDSQQIFNLVSENIEDFKEHDIHFHDILSQPQSMKNGLQIFKVKAVYKNTYSFELQIKSQLDSAWGDMEHQLFYKDYDFTPVKDSVQMIMNQIGKLIIEVDHLLYNVRSAESNYKEEEELSSFKSNLYKEYSEVIKDYLDVPHDQNLGGISNFLYGINKITLNSTESIIPSQIVSFQFTEYNIDDQNRILNNFSKLKVNNFELQVFEFILLNWMKLINVYTEDEDSYNYAINYYINEIYKEYICIQCDIDKEDEIFTEVYKGILSKVSNIKVFLGSNEFYELANYYKVAIDIYNDKYADESFEEPYLRMFIHIPIIYGLYKFDNDLTDHTEELKEVFESDFIYLNQQYDYFKEHINIMKDSNPKAYETNRNFIEDNRKIINILSENGSENK